MTLVKSWHPFRLSDSSVKEEMGLHSDKSSKSEDCRGRRHGQAVVESDIVAVVCCQSHYLKF